jgi:hypothetical protein
MKDDLDFVVVEQDHGRQSPFGFYSNEQAWGIIAIAGRWRNNSKTGLFPE